MDYEGGDDDIYELVTGSRCITTSVFVDSNYDKMDRKNLASSSIYSRQTEQQNSQQLRSKTADAEHAVFYAEPSSAAQSIFRTKKSKFENAMVYIVLMILFMCFQQQQLLLFCSAQSNSVRDDSSFSSSTPQLLHSSMKSVIACHGSTLSLSCSSDAALGFNAAPYNVLNISDVVYGRFSIRVCNSNGTEGWSILCKANDSLSVVYALCHGKRRCDIVVGDATFGDDPCPETLKYLEVQYTCRRRDVDKPTNEPASQQKLVAPAQPFAPALLDNKYFSSSSADNTNNNNNNFDFNPNIMPSLPANDDVDNVMCPETTAGGAVWQRTPRGTTVYLRCPNSNSNNHMQWRCLDDELPHWDYAGPDASQCLVGAAAGTRQNQLPTCEPILMGGVTWPRATPGELVTIPCPHGARGHMRWQCRELQQQQQPNNVVDWDTARGPDMTECSSSWVQQVGSQRVNVDNMLAIVDKIAEKTSANANSAAGGVDGGAGIQYGRDLQALIRQLSTVQRVAELGVELGQLRSVERVANLSSALVQSTSSLLDERNAPAWRDLRRHNANDDDVSASATRLLNTMERHAAMLTAFGPPNEVQKTISENVFIGTGQFNRSTLRGGFRFEPVSRKPTSSAWQHGILDHVELSPRTLDGLVSNNNSVVALSFLAFNDLAKYLGTRLVASADNKFMTTKMPNNSGSVLVLPNNHYTTPLYYEPLLLVNSRIISALAVVGGVERRHGAANEQPTLAEAVVVRLQHLNMNQRGVPMCVQWSSSSYQYGGSYEAAWSREGCRVVQTARDYTICACKRLGSFAVLFDLNGIYSSTAAGNAAVSVENNKLGTIDSYHENAGGFSPRINVVFFVLAFAVSVACLAATLVLLNYALWKKNTGGNSANKNQPEISSISRTQQQTIYKHLTFCLLAAQLILLIITVDRTYLRPGVASCHIAGALMQFFHLSVFAWLLVESRQLFSDRTVITLERQQQQVAVRKSTSSSSWYYFYLAVGYGVPAIIVVVVLLTMPASSVNTSAERSYSCFLLANSTAVLLAGFVAPALFAVVLTWLLLAATFYYTATSNKKQQNNRGMVKAVNDHAQPRMEQQRLKSRICTTLLLTTVLAASCLFGLLSMQTTTGALGSAYVFVVLQSLLGIAVLAVHCACRDEKMFQKLRRFVLRHLPGRLLLSSSPASTTSPMSIHHHHHHQLNNNNNSVLGGAGHHCNGGPMSASHAAAHQWLCSQSSPSSAYSSGTGVVAAGGGCGEKATLAWPPGNDAATMIYGGGGSGSVWNNQLAELAAHHHPNVAAAPFFGTMCRHQPLQQPGLPLNTIQQQQRDRDSGVVSCPSSQRESPPTTTTTADPTAPSLAHPPATNGGAPCCTSNYCPHIHSVMQPCSSGHHHHHHHHQASSTAGAECIYRGSTTTPSVLAAGGCSMLYSDQEHIYQEIQSQYGGAASSLGNVLLQQQQQQAARQHQQHVLLLAAAQQQQQQQTATKNQKLHAHPPPINTGVDCAETASTDIDDCHGDDDDEEGVACSTEPGSDDDTHSSSSSSCGDAAEHKHLPSSGNVNPLAAAAAARAQQVASQRRRAVATSTRASLQHRNNNNIPTALQQLKKKKSLPLPPVNNQKKSAATVHALPHNHSCQQQNSAINNNNGIYQPQSSCSCSSDASSTRRNNNDSNNYVPSIQNQRFSATAKNHHRFRHHSPHATGGMRSQPQQQHLMPPNNNLPASQHIPACFPLAGNHHHTMGMQQQPESEQQFFAPHHQQQAPLSYANTLPLHPLSLALPVQQQHQHEPFVPHHMMIYNQNQPPNNFMDHHQLAMHNNFQQQQHNSRLSAAISNGALHHIPPQPHQNFQMSSSTLHLANSNNNMGKLALQNQQQQQQNVMMMHHRQFNATNVNNSNTNGLSFSEC